MASPKICSKPTVALAASLLSIASGASAAVVCNNTPIAIPATFIGIYVNLVTGASSSTAASVPGWDYDPWSSSGLFSGFFPPTPASSHGAVNAGTLYQVLAGGATVSGANTFGVSDLYTTWINWQAVNTGQYLGLRFFNEATSAINFACVQLDTQNAGFGFPATIQSWCYENTGTTMTCGTTPVELLSISIE